MSERHGFGSRQDLGDVDDLPVVSAILPGQLPVVW